MNRDDVQMVGRETSLAAGTVLVCPCCTHDLYETTTTLVARHVEADNGDLLVPVNPAIPLRDT